MELKMFIRFLLTFLSVMGCVLVIAALNASTKEGINPTAVLFLFSLGLSAMIIGIWSMREEDKLYPIKKSHTSIPWDYPGTYENNTGQSE